MFLNEMQEIVVETQEKNTLQLAGCRYIIIIRLFMRISHKTSYRMNVAFKNYIIWD